MGFELILSSLSALISLISGLSSVLLWVRYVKPARNIIRTVWKDDDLSGEGDLYIIGISGRF
jgi:hypothetical protein